jgi:hypothetical protein
MQWFASLDVASLPYLFSISGGEASFWLSHDCFSIKGKAQDATPFSQ